MTFLDVGKALLLALAIMAVVVALSFVVVSVYAYGVDPGHDVTYYKAVAEQVAPWSSIVCGVVLFYLAGLIAAQRRPERNAIAFALSSAAFYVAINAAILLFAGTLFSLGEVVIVSYMTKPVAALAGARMGIHRRSLASS